MFSYTISFVDLVKYMIQTVYLHGGLFVTATIDISLNAAEQC